MGRGVGECALWSGLVVLFVPIERDSPDSGGKVVSWGWMGTSMLDRVGVSGFVSPFVKRMSRCS